MVHKRTNRRKTLKGGRRTRRKSRKRLAKTRRGLRSKKRKRRRKSRKSRRRSRRGGMCVGKLTSKGCFIKSINNLKLSEKTILEWYNTHNMNINALPSNEKTEVLTTLATKVAGQDAGALYFNNLFAKIRDNGRGGGNWVTELKDAYRDTGLMGSPYANYRPHPVSSSGNLFDTSDRD